MTTNPILSLFSLEIPGVLQHIKGHYQLIGPVSRVAPSRFWSEVVLLNTE